MALRSSKASPSGPSSPSNAAPAPAVPRNPARLAVAQRSSLQQVPSAGPDTLDTAGPNGSSDLDILRRGEVKRAQLIRRIDRWRDRLMEETVDRAAFKKVTSHLTPPQYREIAHERHLNSLCSYGLCSNPPLRPYSTAKRYVISTRARTIKPAEGNEEEGYCSKKCKMRSSWVERSLSSETVWLRTEVKEIELLEELEERGEFTWEPERTTSTTKSNSKTSSSSSDPSLPRASSVTNTLPKKTATESNLLSPVPKVGKATEQENPVSALIANLTIHERPIPVAPPTPPSLTPSTDPSTTAYPSSAQASPVTQVQPVPLPSPRTRQSASDRSTARETRRTPTALMSTSTSGLANTLISATKSLGPVHLTHGQGDDSEEEEDKESDWEKEMGWGEEDDEMKRLFEEARQARELFEE